MVTPKSDNRNKLLQLFFGIEKGFETKGKRIRDAAKKRIKASVNGWILVSAYLKMGEAAPQIILAVIRASMAFLWTGIFIWQIYLDIRFLIQFLAENSNQY